MRHSLVAIIVAFASLVVPGASPVSAQTESQLTVAFDALIAAAFLDPAQTRGLATLFVFLYALHDAHTPIFEAASIHGVGPRVEEPAIGSSPQLYFAGPYEDMRLRRP